MNDNTAILNIDLTASVFKALLRATAKKDIRDWLKGVYLTPSGDLVASNGHIMLIVQPDKRSLTTDSTIGGKDVRDNPASSFFDDVPDAKDGIIIPSDVLKMVVAGTAARDSTKLIYEDGVGYTIYSYGDVLGAYPFVPMAGSNYPSWKRIFDPSSKPLHALPPAVSVNPKYLSDAGRTLTELYAVKSSDIDFSIDILSTQSPDNKTYDDEPPRSAYGSAALCLRASPNQARVEGSGIANAYYILMPMCA